MLRLKRVFRDREFMHYHNDHGMRVIRVSAAKQMLAAGVMTVLALYLLFVSGVALANTVGAEVPPTTAEVQRLEAELAAVRNDVEMKAATLEAKQDIIEQVISGDADVDALQDAAPLFDGDEIGSADILSPFAPVEARQERLFAYAARAAEAHIAARREQLAGLGLSPSRYEGDAVGGPEVALGAGMRAAADANPRFAALLTNWGRLDSMKDEMESLPHVLPASDFRFTSMYGPRRDPFRGRAAMHQGVDFAGPYGTPIRSSAPGKIIKAGWSGGYGKMVEIDHGNGVTSRYAHLSRIHVKRGDRVSAGEDIGKMGSTGRSTGSHLHFEIRVDGRAVDPMPYFEAPILASRDTAPGTAVGN
jgi:murein DD-endopeptidase MepM/ murein hydrolase activator NlpD